MFKKVLLKSAAGTVAAGTVLAGALVATPAVTTVSPEIRNVACNPEYSDDAPTSTALSVRNLVQYGAANTARVLVSSADAPTGHVVVTIPREFRGEDGLSKVSDTASRASVSLPRRLPAGETYTVRANYVPNCDDYKRSSDSSTVTVDKAGTSSAARVADIRRGQRPTVRVGVSSATGIVVNQGSVRVALLKNGAVRQSQTVAMRDGSVAVTFSRIRTRGDWDVRATYTGSSNFRRDADGAAFRVTR